MPTIAARITKLSGDLKARIFSNNTAAATEAYHDAAHEERAAGGDRLLEGHRGKVLSVAWRGAEELVSTSSDGTLALWDVKRSAKTKSVELRTQWSGLSVACSPGGGVVAAGGLDNTVTVWDANLDETARLVGHTGYVSCVRLLADGGALTASGDGTCIVWDVGRAQGLSRFSGGHVSECTTAVPLPGRTNIFATGGADGAVLLYDARAGTDPVEVVLPGAGQAVDDLTWVGPHTALLARDGSQCGSAFDVRMSSNDRPAWSIAFEHNSSVVTGVAGCGSKVFAGTADGQVGLWDVADEIVCAYAFEAAAEEVSWSPRERLRRAAAAGGPSPRAPDVVQDVGGARVAALAVGGEGGMRVAVAGWDAVVRVVGAAEWV